MEGLQKILGIASLKAAQHFHPGKNMAINPKQLRDLPNMRPFPKPTRDASSRLGYYSSGATNFRSTWRTILCNKYSL